MDANNSVANTNNANTNNANTNNTNTNNANTTKKDKKSLYQKFIDFPKTTLGKVTAVIFLIVLFALGVWACDGNLLCLFLLTDVGRRVARRT